MMPAGAQTMPARVLGFIAHGDTRVMRRVHRWLAPRWFRVFMIAATRGGDGWLWYWFGLLVWTFGGPERYAALATASLASGTGLIIYLVVKKATRRRRPCALEPHCWARLTPPDQYSFPSGHTITAFAVAVSLSFYYPDLAFLFLFCAVSIALSRIVLGMHFLSDVLAGFVLGVGLACGMHWMIAARPPWE